MALQNLELGGGAKSGVGKPKPYGTWQGIDYYTKASYDSAVAKSVGEPPKDQQQSQDSTTPTINQAEVDRRNQEAYNLSAERYLSSYNRSLAKYDVAVDQARQQAEQTAQEAYVQKMQSQRTMGNVLEKSGLNAGGYSGIMSGKIQSSYNKAFNTAIQGRNKTIDQYNLEASQLAETTNENLQDVYQKNQYDIPSIYQRSIAKKTYGYR